MLGRVVVARLDCVVGLRGFQTTQLCLSPPRPTACDGLLIRAEPSLALVLKGVFQFASLTLAVSIAGLPVTLLSPQLSFFWCKGQRGQNALMN